jgi:hypothetical protein
MDSSSSDDDSPDNSKRQIVVFDFDETLTKNHLYHALHPRDPEGKKAIPSLYEFTEEWTKDYIFGGQDRIDTLITFLSELVLLDVDLAISSHGNLFEIKKALHFSGIPVIAFKYIHGTNGGIRFLDTITNTSNNMYRNKKNFIESRLQSNDRYGHVIFIDDDEPHGKSKYYNYLNDPNKRLYLGKKITTILMHNVTDEGKDTTKEKGMNAEDHEKIMDAIKTFREEQGGLQGGGKTRSSKNSKNSKKNSRKRL